MSQLWNTLAVQVHEDNVKKGFWPGGVEARNVGELLALVHSEVTEAYDAALACANDDKLTDLPGFDVEIADAMIRLLDASAAYGADIDNSFAGDYITPYTSLEQDMMEIHAHLSGALESNRKGRADGFKDNITSAFRVCAQVYHKWGRSSVIEVINRKLAYNRSRPFMHGKAY